MKRIIIIIVVVSGLGYLGYSYLLYQSTTGLQIRQQELANKLQSELNGHVYTYGHQVANGVINVHVSYFKKERETVNAIIDKICGDKPEIQIVRKEFEDEK